LQGSLHGFEKMVESVLVTNTKQRKSDETRKANRWLRRALNQAAWGAAHFHRLIAKRGSKRAIVAVGHKILVLAHYLLQFNCPVRELGADYLPEASCPKPLPIPCSPLATPWLPSDAHTYSAGNLSIFDRAFGWFGATKFTRAWKPALLWNQFQVERCLGQS
jgi:hypothetical protein